MLSSRIGMQVAAVLALAALAGGPEAAAQPSVRDLIESPSATAEDAGQAGAAASEAQHEPEDPSAPAAATPRGAVRTYLEAVNEGRYADAAKLLEGPSDAAEGAALARQLEVVFDRKLWFDLEALSDRPEGRLEDGLATSREKVGELPSARGTLPVLMTRVEGDEGPIWVFSRSLVSRIPELYDEYGYGPLGRYLPDLFFEIRFLEIQLWQWIGLMTLVVVSAMVGWVLASAGIALLARGLRRASGELGERVVAVASGPLRLALTVFLFSAGKYALYLAIPVMSVLSGVENLLLVVAFAWALLRVADVASHLIEVQLRERQQEAAVTFVPPARKTVKLFVMGIATLAALDGFGFDVTAVLAGLGIGGIAVALAAQKSVENLFGGVTLYTDRPVRVGDFCRFGDQIGTVEEIGLRSTRVRTLDRTIVSIPNAEFANLALENFASRDRIWYHPRIGLRYETTPDQLRYVLVEIRKMLYAHPKVNPDPARIRFVNFGAYSLDLDIFAYVDVTDYGEYLEVCEDLNLRIMDIVAEAGSSFAFPSQTAYIEQGEGLDAERAGQAEKTVARWREENTLYLPRFPEARIRELAGEVDYPPKGSPDAAAEG